MVTGRQQLHQGWPQDRSFPQAGQEPAVLQAQSPDATSPPPPGRGAGIFQVGDRATAPLAVATGRWWAPRTWRATPAPSFPPASRVTVITAL